MFFIGTEIFKVDAHSAELDVLLGASSILGDTEFVILEIPLFQFFKNGPQFFDLVSFMKQQGFVVYDMFGPQYRLLDGAMSAMDIAFGKESGRFRKCHHYATKEQREVKASRR